MCGIAGIICPEPNEPGKTAVQKMTSALAHRGPDGESFWNNENDTVLLGHRRLSIIDLSKEAGQPMSYAHRYHIVHNGEIYNYIELKQTLEQKGYQFSTKSDTEVILAAYDHYQENCLPLFDGMFAFAIWDEQEKKLFAARDRFGEKPFYYSYNKNNRQLFFASELKALWAAGLPRSIDENMLLNYLTLGYTTHPTDSGKTFYSGLFKLPAGHYIQFSPYGEKADIKVTRYWNLDKRNIIQVGEEEAIGQFNQLFHQSVNRRLRADVSIGTSLSGGLDSSSVVAAMHQQLSVNDFYQQQTFTAGFPNYEKDETSYAKIVATQFGLKQYFTQPSAGNLADEMVKLVHHHEEPISSASVYAQYKVFELAKQHNVKVLLDGQGADEILAGYPKYIHWFLQEQLSNLQFRLYRREKKSLDKHAFHFEWKARNYLAALLPEVARRQLEKKALRSIANNHSISEEFKTTFFNKEACYKPVIRSLNDSLYYNTSQLGLEELLRYADKNSMAHGREVRLPFLQHELVQFIFSLQATYKIHSGYTKWILRKAMQPILPNEIVWRTDKTGFEPPQQQWMEHSAVLDLIRTAKEQLVKQRVLNASELNKKIQPHSAYAAEYNDWRYLTAGLLYL